MNYKQLKRAKIATCQFRCFPPRKNTNHFNHIMSFGYPYHHSAPVSSVPQPRSLAVARQRYEMARGFDLEDDLDFCPNLLSDEELLSVSSGSDRSSSASSSPESSPLQLQIKPSSASSSYTFSQTQYNPAAMFNPPSHIKLQHASSVQLQQQQENQTRTRNAIPIVNPNTGMRVASPPLNARAQQYQSPLARRLW